MTLPQNLAEIRRNYALKGLHRNMLHTDPIQQFNLWMQEAIDAKVLDPTAMMLSTVSDNGRPAGRVVLLKEVINNTFVFYTNYTSRKGRDLQKTPFAALTFFWPEIERQVRIEGLVEEVPEEVSEAYFRTRPKGSQLGAWVSAQSTVIENRAALEALQQEYTEKFKDEPEIPRPLHWGGFALEPDRIEFWQGRPDRLHDRFEYRKDEDDDSWQASRLAP